MSKERQAPPGHSSDRARTYTIDGHAVDAGKLAPGLHIVATPIGIWATSRCGRSRRWQAPT